MDTPENEKQRRKAVESAGAALAVSIFPSEGYNPKTIGRTFADAIMRQLEESQIEYDLGQECLAIILDCAVTRLNEHFDSIHDDKPLPPL